MSWPAAIVIALPSILYLITSIIQTYVTIRKMKEERKDEIWETTTKLLCKSSDQSNSTDFAMLYQELKYFKEHPEWSVDAGTIRSAMQANAAHTEAGTESRQTE